MACVVVGMVDSGIEAAEDKEVGDCGEDIVIRLPDKLRFCEDEEIMVELTECT